MHVPFFHRHKAIEEHACTCKVYIREVERGSSIYTSTVLHVYMCTAYHVLPSGAYIYACMHGKKLHNYNSYIYTLPPVPPYRLFLDHMGWPAGFEFAVLMINYINLDFSSPYI